MPKPTPLTTTLCFLSALLLFSFLFYGRPTSIINLYGSTYPYQTVHQPNMDTILATTTWLSRPSATELTATTKNTSKHPLTILVWNSPLDPKAANLGVFTVDGEKVGGVMFNRKMPPAESDYVMLQPGEKISVVHTLPEGKVKAEWAWMGVWEGMEKGTVVGGYGSEDVGSGIKVEGLAAETQ
ncbi:hypothetical protein EDC01DRAFT_784946 [Geopyxis carbonaria]|nr:hypothetical protein EDC01DRAFT_784946 [Geopyxis carbonaria]